MTSSKLRAKLIIQEVYKQAHMCKAHCIAPAAALLQRQAHVPGREACKNRRRHRGMVVVMTTTMTVTVQRARSNYHTRQQPNRGKFALQKNGLAGSSSSHQSPITCRLRNPSFPQGVKPTFFTMPPEKAGKRKSECQAAKRQKRPPLHTNARTLTYVGTKISASGNPIPPTLLQKPLSFARIVNVLAGFSDKQTCVVSVNKCYYGTMKLPRLKVSTTDHEANGKLSRPQRQLKHSCQKLIVYKK